MPSNSICYTTSVPHLNDIILSPYRFGMSDFGDGKEVDDVPVFQGKVIILGDSGTGKSSLLNSLKPISQPSERAQGSAVFSVVELSPYDIKFDGKVLLKVWEYSGRDDPIVFEGAVIVIITLDLRIPETAYNAFSRWTELKTKYMDEAFLFVVGNFLDSTMDRRVEISEVTRACAKQEAVYVEVSNTTGVNISLFRRIIANSVKEVLHKRKEIFDMIQRAEKDVKVSYDDLRNFDAETGTADADERKLDIDGIIATPFLEKDLTLSSIGALLSSCMGTEYWPGYENESDGIRHIGEHIHQLIDRIGDSSQVVPGQPMEYVVEERTAKPDTIPVSQEEIEEAFRIMGFQLPPAMFTTTPSSPVPVKKHKIKITLPSGETGKLILYDGYNLEDQVDAFMKQHGLSQDFIARERILSIAKTVASKGILDKRSSSPKRTK